MLSTNGHGPKRAILYARVSTDEQARSGYSLAQQLEALRGYAAREGYEVLEEVEDAGQSGASLERPGMDHVRDLVAAGGVSVVLAQDRDRFAREPAYHYLLRRELEEHGTKLKALNDHGDNSPEGELTDGILDQLAKFERAKIAQRSRRGKLRKAREGKIIAGRLPDFGFRFNEVRDGYVVDEDAIRVVRRIFEMVGGQGHSLNAVRRTFTHEGIKPPAGGRRWEGTFIRERIQDDVYKPHTHEELRELLSPEVAARLDPQKLYGVWWYNRRCVERRQVSEDHPGGRNYRKRVKTILRPRSEWIAVPVPDCGIPRELVEAARAAIKDNHNHSSAGRRYWELSGGIFRCEGCGRVIQCYSQGSSHGKFYYYYGCPVRRHHGKDACPVGARFPAHDPEALVWNTVSVLLKDPELLRRGLKELVEHERNASRGNPEAETRAWREKLAEVDRKRSVFHNLAAESLMTLDELRKELAELEDVRTMAERELATLWARTNHVKALEHDVETLIESYAEATPTALDALGPQEHHQIYRMLRLEVVACGDDTLRVDGNLLDRFCIEGSTQRR
jgi:site-specific DNA recombinase